MTLRSNKIVCLASNTNLCYYEFKYYDPGGTRMREKERENTAQEPIEKKSGFWSVMGFLFRIRSVFLAIPVLTGAISMAVHNYNVLPEQVGLSLQSSGEYAQLISKNIAVFGPLVITMACLLLMFCSRKVLYPWLISLFSLVLPVLIWLTYIFHG